MDSQETDFALVFFFFLNKVFKVKLLKNDYVSCLYKFIKIVSAFFLLSCYFLLQITTVR